MTTNEVPQDLRSRTSEFALRIIRLYTSLPKTTEAQVIGKQVLRSGTSIGAHYREGHRAKSDATSSTNLKRHYRNWMKPITGLTCS
jgi:four helix bundle protein